MRHKTHIRVTKGMFPWIKPDVIQKVNSALDSPTRQQKMLFTNGIPIPGLNMYPHRRYTHTMQDAILTGYMTAGLDGAYAAMGHMIGDITRDQTVARVGGLQADVLEAFFNLYMNKKQ